MKRSGRIKDSDNVILLAEISGQTNRQTVGRVGSGFSVTEERLIQIKIRNSRADSDIGDSP